MRPIAPARPGIDARDVERFVKLLLGPDDAALDVCLRDLWSRGVSTEQVYMDLMGPAANEIGRMWEDDDCDFLEVTVALGRLQRLVRGSAERFRREISSRGRELARPTGRIFLCCLPSRDHSFGLLLLSEFLLREGWRVQFGSPFGPGQGIASLAAGDYDVVGISVSCDFTVDDLVTFVRDVRSTSRNPGVRVLVGGRVINESPRLVTRVGADATAIDARSAVTVAASLLP